MFDKDWTPETIGRLTLTDLRILCNEKAPPEPYSAQPVPVYSPADVERVLKRREAERNSWLR